MPYQQYFSHVTAAKKKGEHAQRIKMTCKRYGMLESHSPKQRNNVFKMFKKSFFNTMLYHYFVCFFKQWNGVFFQRCVHIGIE